MIVSMIVSRGFTQPLPHLRALCGAAAAGLHALLLPADRLQGGGKVQAACGSVPPLLCRLAALLEALPSLAQLAQLLGRQVGLQVLLQGRARAGCSRTLLTDGGAGTARKPWRALCPMQQLDCNPCTHKKTAVRVSLQQAEVRCARAAGRLGSWHQLAAAGRQTCSRRSGRLRAGAAPCSA